MSLILLAAPVAAFVFALALYFALRSRAGDDIGGSPAWLIDREGVVYKPTRRVVLKAK